VKPSRRFPSPAHRFAGILFFLIPLMAPGAAQAATCAGKTDALGTSRTLTVDPKTTFAVGKMMYPDTLPLQDHEVVLTFDDGPLPHKTSAVLDELARECVKATFFIIGRMAKQYPELVQRIHAEGHTIGTHTQNHLLTLRRRGADEVKREIDDGIASTVAAAGSADAVSPFLRLPGLRFSPEIEQRAKEEGLMIWSSDAVADDWRRISSKRVVTLALERLEQRGRGILLLHDIQKRTAGALPQLLEELKRRHYSIVHVVAAPHAPKTASVIGPAAASASIPSASAPSTTIASPAATRP